MKIFYIIYFLLLSIFCFSQVKYDSIRIKYDSISKQYAKLELQNDDVDYLADALANLRPSYSKILYLDDLNIPNLQKALIKEYGDKFTDAFISRIDAKSKMSISYGFKTKKDVNEYIDLAEAWLLHNLAYLKNSLCLNYKIKVFNYLETNLKRLGITQRQYDSMSDTDRQLLIEQFK